MISEFEISLVCRASSRKTRVTQRNPVSKRGVGRKKDKLHSGLMKNSEHGDTGEQGFETSLKEVHLSWGIKADEYKILMQFVKCSKPHSQDRPAFES